MAPDQPVQWLCIQRLCHDIKLNLSTISIENYKSLLATDNQMMNDVKIDQQICKLDLI